MSTFSRLNFSSSLVYETIKAAPSKERLSVIVVDNPGTPTGINLLQSLAKLGIKVFYRILPDLAHIINKVISKENFVLLKHTRLLLNHFIILCAAFSQEMRTHSLNKQDEMADVVITCLRLNYLTIRLI